MKILLTGATGYIGRRLIPILLEQSYKIVCCVRDKKRFDISQFNSKKISVIEVNFLKPQTLKQIPDDIDAAYYLIHSMSSSVKNFELLEETSARNFVARLNNTKVQQVIYLSGIVNEKNFQNI